MDGITIDKKRGYAEKIHISTTGLIALPIFLMWLGLKGLVVVILIMFGFRYVKKYVKGEFKWQ